MKRKFDDNYRRRKGKEFQRACRGFDNSQTMIKRRMEELLQQIEQLKQRIRECETRINDYQYHINLANQSMSGLNGEISGYENTIRMLQSQLK